MAVQLAEGIILEGYNALRTGDVASLESMFTSYLLDEFDRVGEMAFGNPVAGYLSTALLRCEGEDAGFLSFDTGRLAVEVIYVKDWFRGCGLATLALADLNRHCPQTLALKTPCRPAARRSPPGWSWTWRITHRPRRLETRKSSEPSNRESKQDARTRPGRRVTRGGPASAATDKGFAATRTSPSGCTRRPHACWEADRTAPQRVCREQRS
ncbi:hypothetical protein ABZ092_33815 [Streptomyces bobili]|uniref:hypothetical protein n=1 Tax=Streptomyces bobili TaxID=67280 RepID=UPI0033AA356C